MTDTNITDKKLMLFPNIEQFRGDRYVLTGLRRELHGHDELVFFMYSSNTKNGQNDETKDRYQWSSSMFYPRIINTKNLTDIEPYVGKAIELNDECESKILNIRPALMTSTLQDAGDEFFTLQYNNKTKELLDKFNVMFTEQERNIIRTSGDT